jgi:hypothetical protein
MSKGCTSFGPPFFVSAHQIKRAPSVTSYLCVIPNNLLWLAPKTCKETNDQEGASDASKNSIPFDLNPIVPLLQPLSLHLA